MDVLLDYLKLQGDGGLTVYFGSYYHENISDVCHEWPREKIMKFNISNGCLIKFNSTMDQALDVFILNMKNGIISYVTKQMIAEKQVFQIVRGRWRKWDVNEVIERICLRDAIAV